MSKNNNIVYRSVGEEKLGDASLVLDGDENKIVYLGRLGMLALEHMKIHRPKMYSDLKAQGILEKTAYEMQQSVKQQMETIEKQLRIQNPPPKTENTMELYQYNQWVRDTVWELVKEQILLPDEEDQPEL